MRKRIAILAAPGFTDSGISITLDVLRTADSLRRRAQQPPLFEIELVSIAGGEVAAASGLAVARTRDLTRLQRAAVVLVPGFWVEDAREVDAAIDDEALLPALRALKAAHARGALICSSCAGAFILARAGLLDGLQATTAWWLAPHLQRRFPQIEVHADAAMLVQGKLITAGALFAQADIALHIVTQLGGPSLARTCARMLLLDRHGSQTPYMALRQLTANDEVVRKAEKWVRANLAEPFDIPALAKRLGVSARTLARKLENALGLSPIELVQKLRVEAAVHLLETTRMPLDEISRRVGYADPHTLSRLIRRELEVTPRELRRKQKTKLRHAS